MNVLVLSELDDAQLSDLSALLARSEEADGHSALADPERAAAAAWRDLGAEGAEAVLAYEGDSLVGCVFITPATDGATALHVAIDPPHRGPGFDGLGGSGGGGGGAGVDAGGESIRTTLLRTALEHTHDSHRKSELVRLWLMKATDDDDAEAALLGFTPERDLLQMRVRLPLPSQIVASARPVVTRPFEPGRDEEDWLVINNLAFADHPEQGGWTLEDLRERMTAEWFDPKGFLVADNEDGTGLIGSCWDKVHLEGKPIMGEIYVISVNPARQGEGWGRGLTVAGLQWIAARGITVGMLYTTSSNTPAVALYKALGFTIDHVDRSYVLHEQIS